MLTGIISSTIEKAIEAVNVQSRAPGSRALGNLILFRCRCILFQNDFV